MNELVDRVREGLTAERDALLIERVLRRLVAYEIALRRIAVHGTGGAAALAARTLCDPDAAYEPSIEAIDACRKA